jgi:ketosteroid isomerase-like protein
MRFRNVATVLCLIVAALILIQSRGRSSAQTERGKALESLIEAERAFARTSAEKGIREAFLTWLAPDSTVFRPAPVPGRPVYEKMDPADPAVLTWEPEVADIAASGEMGYTSGPYIFRAGPGKKPTGFGHYVSVWKKGSDGVWRVFLDAGIPYESPPAPAPITVVVAPRPDAAFPELPPEAHRDEYRIVAERYRKFTEAVTSRGYRGALADFATEDVRVYRPGHPPAVGKSLIKELIPKSTGRYSPPRNPRQESRRIHKSNFRAEVAWSGDLAATFGTYEQLGSRGTTEEAAFLKIWRKARPEDTWDVCLDLEIPIPAVKEEKKTNPS